VTPPWNAKAAKKLLSFFASFALAKPKLAGSPSSEGWASAFDRDVF
jgi:hypothetical protein